MDELLTVKQERKSMTAKEIAEAMIHIANCTTNNKNLEVTARKCASEVMRLGDESQKHMEDLEEARIMIREQNRLIATLCPLQKRADTRRPAYNYAAKLTEFAGSSDETMVVATEASGTSRYPKADVFRKTAARIGLSIGASACGDYVLLYKLRLEEKEREENES